MITARRTRVVVRVVEISSLTSLLLQGRPYFATQPQWLHAQKPRDTKSSILRGYNHSKKGIRKVWPLVVGSENTHLAAANMTTAATKPSDFKWSTVEVQWSAIVIRSSLERGQKSLQLVGLLKLSYLGSEEKNGRVSYATLAIYPKRDGIDDTRPSEISIFKAYVSYWIRG